MKKNKVLPHELYYAKKPEGNAKGVSLKLYYIKESEGLIGKSLLKKYDQNQFIERRYI